MTGWWFQTWRHYFPFHIWDVIIPIDELIFFMNIFEKHQISRGSTFSRRFPPMFFPRCLPHFSKAAEPAASTAGYAAPAYPEAAVPSAPPWTAEPATDSDEIWPMKGRTLNSPVGGCPKIVSDRVSPAGWWYLVPSFRDLWFQGPTKRQDCTILHSTATVCWPTLWYVMFGGSWAWHHQPGARALCAKYRLNRDKELGAPSDSAWTEGLAVILVVLGIWYSLRP